MCVCVHARRPTESVRVRLIAYGLSYLPLYTSVVYMLPLHKQMQYAPNLLLACSVKATRFPDDTVLLSWQHLTFTEAKGFPLYIVSYKSVEGSSRGSVNTTSSSVVINSPKSKVGYIFSKAAWSEECVTMHPGLLQSTCTVSISFSVNSFSECSCK